MDFIYQDPYPILKDETQYRKITSDFVKVEQLGEREILNVDPKGLELLAQEAMRDVSFMLRTSHLEKLRAILDDPEATDNDRFVAYNLLQNAVVAIDGELPSCQDTGTAIVMAKKGENVYTGVDDVLIPIKKKTFVILKLCPLACLKKKIQDQTFRLKLIFMLKKELHMNFCF